MGHARKIKDRMNEAAGTEDPPRGLVAFYGHEDRYPAGRHGGGGAGMGSAPETNGLRGLRGFAPRGRGG